MTAHRIEIGCTLLAPLLGVAVLGPGVVRSVRHDIWPSRCMYNLHASVTNRISPFLSTLHNCCVVVYV